MAKKSNLEKRVQALEKKIGIDSTPTDISVVLDMSGSMSNLRDETISAVNAFIKEQQELKSPATFSLVMFDTEFITVYENEPIENVKPITNATYAPRGINALFDAVGHTLTRLFKINPAKAVVVVVTDGYENSSRKFTSDQIKSEITKAQNRNWQMVYLGANQDAWAIGGSYGYSATSTASWAGGIGLASGMSATSTGTIGYRSTGNSIDLTDTSLDGLTTKKQTTPTPATNG